VKKNIVIISNYYPPEMGAAANRIKNLAEGLKNDGNKVTIICPLPNYPKGEIFKKYKNKFSVSETINDIKVKRYWIFPSKSTNPVVRLLSMLSFSWSMWFSIFILFKNKTDVFIIQSPPLLVGFSGLLLSKFLRSKNILNVSDIWPLSAYELGVIKKGFFYQFLELIEKVNYRLADKIVGQSEETILHISKIVDKEFLVYRNVPKYYKNQPKLKNNTNLKIVYAGLLGYAQDVLNICNKINFKELDVEFHIYGGGMEEEAIKELAEVKKSNIFFYGVKKPEEIRNEINKFDVGFVPLKNKIHGAVPSKIFELMQLGIPILFFGEGEGSKIVIDNNIGMSTNSDSINDLKNMILEFKEMTPNKFKEMSSNSLNLHHKKYHLEYQLKNFIKLLN
jgi:glycosyltransferase involved in cell wall biosynthesis